LTCDEPLVFIPNAFTPNGDGKNDILYVRSVLLEKVQWMIYNRWGEKVFETNNLEQGWDGLYKGKHCEPGVYDYYFEGTCTNGEVYVHKGNVTILR
ncbi:MAG: gliding motility-associated C-terminal domain-containing protein, partial [Bacteroidales bacterium]